MVNPTLKPTGQGRYDLAGARAPANGLGRPPASLNIRTAIAAVPDPIEKGARLLANVNRRVDILENERSHHLISEAAYQAGRQVQAIFERVKGPGSSNWQGGSRVDASTAHDLAIDRGIETAQKIERFISWLRHELGREDAKLLRRVLGDRWSYAAIAAEQMKFGRDEVGYVARRFRDALELLANAKAARGQSGQRSR